MRFFDKSSSDCLRASTGPAAGLLLSLLALSPLAVANPPPHVQPHVQPPILPPGFPGDVPQGPAGISGQQSFKLRHVLHHGSHKYPRLFRRLDVKPSDTFWVADDASNPKPVPSLKAKSYPKPMRRLINREKDVMEEFLMMQRYGWAQSLTADAWVIEETPQPNITDKETVVNLAKMTADAYVEVPGTEDWVDIGRGWNITGDFGWEGDGLRGHIWVDDANTTVIVGLKGTSPAVFDGPETTTNDKINDNLLFSCCCGRVSRWWKTVCDCYSGTAYTCGKTCLKTALTAENRYYRAALNLYYNVTQMYPETPIWLVGHSLGGAVSSLVGQTYSLPVVTFEAPGEALASSRLGLPVPPGGSEYSGTYHFGHSADPLFMGSCNGATSPCSIGGYAMESGCHSGYECLYDVVGDKGWRVGLGYHRIQTVIKDVIEVYPDVAECKLRPDCVDCELWKFTDSNTTKPTKTLSSTTTTTCKTKGWWGCLDEPTGTTNLTTTLPATATTTTTTITTTTTTTSTTSTTTTTTCTSYGWFGNCLDGIASTRTPTTTTVFTTTESLPTTTCTHRGWLGKCLDGISSTTDLLSSTTDLLSSTTDLSPSASIIPSPPPTSTQTHLQSVLPIQSESCKHRGWFGGCLDPTWMPDDPVETETKTLEPKPTTTAAGGGDCDWWSFWCEDGDGKRRKGKVQAEELR